MKILEKCTLASSGLQHELFRFHRPEREYENGVCKHFHSGAFTKSCALGDRFDWIGVHGSPIRKGKVAFLTITDTRGRA